MSILRSVCSTSYAYVKEYGNDVRGIVERAWDGNMNDYFTYKLESPNFLISQRGCYDDDVCDSAGLAWAECDAMYEKVKSLVKPSHCPWERKIPN